MRPAAIRTVGNVSERKRYEGSYEEGPGFCRRNPHDHLPGRLWSELEEPIDGNGPRRGGGRRVRIDGRPARGGVKAAPQGRRRVPQLRGHEHLQRRDRHQRGVQEEQGHGPVVLVQRLHELREGDAAPPGAERQVQGPGRQRPWGQRRGWVHR